MKKIIFIFLLVFSAIINVNAQILSFRTTAYAYASVYNGIYNWGSWQSSNMIITINLNKDVITVYSPKTQIYKVYGSYNNGNWYTDNNGGKTIRYYVIDQDYDKGNVRLRVESNGNSQIYIDFNDCAWVYNVVRTS